MEAQILNRWLIMIKRRIYRNLNCLPLRIYFVCDMIYNLTRRWRYSERKNNKKENMKTKSKIMQVPCLFILQSFDESILTSVDQFLDIILFKVQAVPISSSKITVILRAYRYYCFYWKTEKTSFERSNNYLNKGYRIWSQWCICFLLE